MFKIINKIEKMREYSKYITKKNGIYLLIISIAFLLAFCNKEQKSSCDIPEINEPDRFVDCKYGSGNFGMWVVDEHGLPAYEYTLNHEEDARALWWNTAKKDNRSHSHQIGNFRFSAIADNNGFIQIFIQENGFKWLNFYNEKENNYSGNFAIIDDGKSIWATAYKFRPKNAKVKRVFGIAYYLIETEHNELIIKRKTFAPYGNDPILISEISIENKSKDEKQIDYYEYWDVNIHHLLMKFISSGVLDQKIPQKNEEDRILFNRYFVQSVRIDEEKNIAIVDTQLKYPEANELKIPHSDQAKDFDPYPPSIFLVPLDSQIGEGFIFEQNKLFNEKKENNPFNTSIRYIPTYKSNSEIPDNLRNVPGLNQPLALVHKRNIKIKPKELVKIYYAYGYIPPSTKSDFINKYINNIKGKNGEDLLKDTLKKWKERLAFFVPEVSKGSNDGFLHREIAWHSYYIQSSAYWREYTKTYIVSQGGEYLFGHGFDGATRDYCIFSVVLTYLNPEIAKDILRFIMLTTSPNGEKAYANYGDTSIAIVPTLSKPSDLDVFFLWAMAEYLLATGDYDFLNEKLPFYSHQNIFSAPTSSVFDHIRIAFEHLKNDIGTGEHGLIKIRTGDWSDGILWFTENPSITEEKGESTFTTAFAVYALPRIAEAIEQYDSNLAQSMREEAENYKTAMKKQWGGRWYFRGWEGNGKPFGDDRIFLEPQVWALISRIPDEKESETLINSIYTILDANSPIGARIVYPPKENIIGGLEVGTDVNGGIWPAVNSLLTWAYSLYNKDYAWEEFKKNTLASHAETYPNIWYGIWSGPDSYNSPESSRPGEAAAHQATALTDHPVFNANQHANPLLSLIKLAGINPRKEGYEIFPRFPFKRWILNLPLIGIKYDDKNRKIYGYIYSLFDRNIKLWIKIPSSIKEKESIKVKIIDRKEGKENQIDDFTLDIPSETVSFQFNTYKNKKIEWEIKY